MSEHTRRQMLGAVGAGVASLSVVGSASAMRADCGAWHAVESPTDRTLTDVVRASGTRVAVGGGGRVLRKASDRWRLVTADGVSGDGRNLHAAAVTDDGSRVWLVGASGALGVYDARTDSLSAVDGPADVTNTLSAVAVTGARENETVVIGDDSGHVHRRGSDGTWTSTTPGDGTALTGLAAGDAGVAAVDASGSAFADLAAGTASESGRSDAGWLAAGIPGSDALRGVDGTSPRSVVAVGDGVYDATERGWETAKPVEDALTAVAVADCGCVHAVGANGVVLDRMRGSATWRTQETNTEADLRGVAVGDPHVAVGANGAILEM